MRHTVFEILAILLIGLSLGVFWKCASCLAQRDYVASLVLLGIGVSVVSVGKEMARLALRGKE